MDGFVKKMIQVLVATAAFFVGSFVSVGQAYADATFIVNSTEDVVDVNPGDGICETVLGSGVCTLRAAIQESNSTLGINTIMLLAGNYELTISGSEEDYSATGDLDIRKYTKLMGEGADVTIINGLYGDRVLSVSGGSEIEGVTIRGGRLIGGLGAGIVGNNLKIRSSIIENNYVYANRYIPSKGGGIYGGNLEIVDSQIINNEVSSQYWASGAGIYTQGNIVIERSLIGGNKVNSPSSAEGGGMYVYGGGSNLHINDSSFVNNSVSGGSGGAIAMWDVSGTISGSNFGYNYAFGTSVFYIKQSNGSYHLSIENSTINNNRTGFNTVGGAIVISEGALDVINSTFSENYAPYTSPSSIINASNGVIVTMVNSIFNVDKSSSSPGCIVETGGGNFVSLGHNVINDDTCGSVVDGDLQNTNPILGTLDYYGGTTLVYSLLEGSPAIDTADPVYCPEIDQRGVSRPQMAGCDIGAFEVEPFNAFPIADAGEDQQVNEGSEMVFDGSGSTDLDGNEDIVSYDWDFGDGSFGSGVTTTHIYADNDVYTATLTVTDSQGVSDSDTVTVTVSNVAPIVNLPITIQVSETDTISVAGSFIDPGADSWLGSVDYGDGSVLEPVIFDANNNFVLNHMYVDPGTYTMTVTVTDDDGGIGVGTVEVATYSVLVIAGQDVTVSLSGVTITFLEVTTEGIVTIVVTNHPQGGNPPSQYRFLNTYYELTTTAEYAGLITVSFVYDEADVHGLEENLKLFHWDGSGWQDITVQVDTVNNIITGETETLSPFAVGDLLNTPPTVDAGGPYSVDEGGSVEVTALGSDAESTNLMYAWDLDEDGVFETTGQAVIFSAVDLDGPTNKTIVVEITDEGGLTAVDETIVEVFNLAPVLGEITTVLEPVMVGTQIQTSVDLTDSGKADTHTAIWDWGDSTQSAGLVTESDGVGTVTGEHIYANAGVYTLNLTVTDDDGGVATAIYTYVVVYDADGGFVTGGGWIESPLGAYADDPTLTGKANFGFNSKYKPGKEVPSGETEFRFKAGDLDFHSTDYEWLVVAGAQAKYKGSGIINGTGDYGFMLSARDSSVNGGGIVDTFRIKIWDKSTEIVVYDNQMGDADDAETTTEIGGGNIVVHK